MVSRRSLHGALTNPLCAVLTDLDDGVVSPVERRKRDRRGDTGGSGLSVYGGSGGAAVAGARRCRRCRLSTFSSMDWWHGSCLDCVERPAVSGRWKPGKILRWIPVEGRLNL